MAYAVKGGGESLALRVLQAGPVRHGRGPEGGQAPGRKTKNNHCGRDKHHAVEVEKEGSPRIPLRV
ncbi:MAG: hypothetical protein JKP92_02760 [Alphaproteobacteria bacterium]|nr:hypothetical protein [Alphaproteobacteria bacterium]